MNKYDILYLDIKEPENSSGSLVLTYYMLSCSGLYIRADESEKEYGVIRVRDIEQAVAKVAELVNSICSDLDALLILSGRSDLTYLLSKVEDCLYVSANLNWESLQSYLNCEGMTMFELYSHFFNVSPEDDFMCIIDKLISGVVRYKHGSLFEETCSIIIIQPLVRGRTSVLTFSWAMVNFRGELTVLGSEQCMLINEGDNYCKLGIFFKELETKIAESGTTLDGLVPVFYTESYYKTYRNLVDGMDVSLFSNHICLTSVVLDTLPETFKTRIGSSFSNFMRVFSSKVSLDYKLSSKELCSVIRSLSENLKMSVSDSGGLSIEGTFDKDFSSDTLSSSVDVPMKYVVVLDCEGVPARGCSEVGGVIAAYNLQSRIFVKVETFKFRQVDFVEGLQAIYDRFVFHAGRSYGQGIPVLTYGKLDAVMIKDELKNTCNKSTYKRLSKLFNFIDAQEKIYSYLDKLGVDLFNRKLNTVAKYLGVRVVYPLHDSLNDAKTLFNVIGYLTLFEDTKDGVL